VTHEQALVSQAVINEFAFDSLDTSIHHVARCNAVSARKRDLGDALRRGVRIDCTVLVKYTTMSVRGVLAETDVRRDEQAREERAQFFDGQDHGPLWVICGRTASVLSAGQRHAEEDDASEALLHQWSDETLQSVDTPPALTW